MHINVDPVLILTRCRHYCAISCYPNRLLHLLPCDDMNYNAVVVATSTIGVRPVADVLILLTSDPSGVPFQSLCRYYEILCRRRTNKRLNQSAYWS